MYKITAAQILKIDEVMADKKATDHTLKVALQYHSNLINEYNKRERAWWAERREE